MDYSKICNGHQDCTDNSDEHGCSEDDPNPPQGSATCPRGQYSCDDGACFDPSTTMCDGHMDCLDGTDEAHCELSVSVMGLATEPEEATATTLRVHWWIPDISSHDLKYSPGYAVAGTDRWNYLDWTNASDFTYVFRNLYPYTNYNLTLNVKDKDGTVHNTSRFAQGLTAPYYPSKPTIINVEQVERKIRVSWTPPARPNGLLDSFIVTMTPGGREWFKNGGSATSITLDDIFLPKTRYTFTVTAKNTVYTGNASQPMSIVYDEHAVREEVDRLVVKDVGENYVTLNWAEIPGIEYFKVSYKSHNPYAAYEDIRVHGALVNVTGLSPAEKYTVSVAALLGNETGPWARKQVSTTGRPLPRPEITDAKVTVRSATSIKLTWKLPEDEKRKTKWTYGIFYGISYADMTSKGLRASADSTSFTVQHLDACESYSFVVSVIGPFGFGPASPPFAVSTKYSAGAPPKELKAALDPDEPTKMIVEWKASCDRIEQSIGYLLSVRDLTTGKTTHNQYSKVTMTEFKKPVEGFHFGASYAISVRTDAPDAIPSKEVIVKGPRIPRPIEVTHQLTEGSEMRQMIYWRPATNLPSYLGQEYTYTIHVSEKADLSNPTVFNVTRPPFELPTSGFSYGRLYFLGVALVDRDGYSSEFSTPLGFEIPVPAEDIVISKSSAASVVVPLIVVLILLACGLGYYVHRNRKLTRNFQAFASRYSPATGASILNQSALEDEDDDESPIIRGFSDNEPLVI